MDTMQSVGGFDGGADIAGRGGARQFKVDRVYLALKQAIVAGELAPMALVDKGEWSARFGVSRLSITSAINRLAFEGLVVIEPQRGSYVSKISAGGRQAVDDDASLTRSRGRGALRDRIA